MKRGLYILNYHNISWEDHQLTRGIGAIFPPDVFLEHLEVLRGHFRLVSTYEGLRALDSKTIREPLLAFWFDDGQPGVRQEAAPALNAHGITGAMSVNSRFMLRTDFHWRFKVSLISQLDGMRILRNELRKLHIDVGQGVKAASIDAFSPQVLEAIDRVFCRFANETLRADMYRLFEDVTGIRALSEEGWMIANHSAAHYPISEESCVRLFHEQFMECDQVLRSRLGITTDYWVLPFDREANRAGSLMETFEASRRRVGRDLKLVLVGNQINLNPEPDHTIYRIGVPLERGKGLISYLARL